MRRLAFSIVIAGAAALAIVGLANGAAPTQKSVSFPVPGNDDAHDVAKCKSGQEAVAGGFRTEIEPFGDLVYPLDSARAGKRKWFLRAKSTTPVDSTATVYAYCDKHKQRLDEGAKVVTLDPAPGEVQRVTQRCAPAAEVVGGGFGSDFEGDAFVVSSKRVGRRGWQVGFVPGDNPNGDDVSVDAYCDVPRPGLKIKTRSTEVLPGPPSSVKARCGHGKRLSSGGFELSYSDDANGYVTESRRAGKRRWKVSGFAVEGNPKVSAYAYCERGKSQR